MKVKELIEALQKVENQDAIAIFIDGEMNLIEIDKVSDVWEVHDEKLMSSSDNKGIIPIVSLT